MQESLTTGDSAARCCALKCSESSSLPFVQLSVLHTYMSAATCAASFPLIVDSVCLLFDKRWISNWQAKGFEGNLRVKPALFEFSCRLDPLI